MSAAQTVTFDHESVANESKHWVRLTAACNSKCVFCLDSEAQDGRFMSFDDICVEVKRGREDKVASRLVVSGGEASIHPRFHDVIRYAKSLNYRWVQTVTNGQKLADKEFFYKAVDAGLDEITFSLHGHTPELHDRLTRTKNGFENLMRAMMRAVRDGRVIVNVDVCINKQNVEHLEAIVALCARVGVREFDLLHVIPQGVAFEHRDELFYDVDAHAESLRKVFRLARHPGFHIWTNRFPVSHLEGMEELIQDPHKMLDEVGGRRTQFRRYLDEGTAIDCRDKERCPHCFIEPFCSTLDRDVSRLSAGTFDVWQVGSRHELAGVVPAGIRWLGVDELPAGRAEPPSGEDRPALPLRISAQSFVGMSIPAGSRIVATRPEQLAEAKAHPDVEVELHLDKSFCAWLLDHPEALRPRHILHAPSRAKASESAELDPDWKAFFTAIRPMLAFTPRVSNLPACLCPGSEIESAPKVLNAELFHVDGRIAIDAYVDHYIESEYHAKSLRCRACPADKLCRGRHIQALRAHGFAKLQPLEGEWAVRAVEQLQALAEPMALLRDGAPPLSPPPRVPVAGNEPVPFIDTEAGRRS